MLSRDDDGQASHQTALESLCRAECYLRETAKAWDNIHQVEDLPEIFYMTGKLLPLLLRALRSIARELEKASTAIGNFSSIVNFSKKCDGEIRYLDDVFARVTDDAKLSKAERRYIVAKEQGGVSLEAVMKDLLTMALRINISGHRFFEDGLMISIEKALEDLSRLTPSPSSMGTSGRVLSAYSSGTQFYHSGSQRNHYKLQYLLLIEVDCTRTTSLVIECRGWNEIEIESLTYQLSVSPSNLNTFQKKSITIIRNIIKKSERKLDKSLPKSHNVAVL